MRKPRDIDTELEALAARTRALKARRIVQLGELVIATGADALAAEALAGALLAAAATSDPKQLAAWRAAGAALFRREPHPGGTAPDAQAPGESARPNPPG